MKKNLDEYQALLRRLIRLKEYIGSRIKAKTIEIKIVKHVLVVMECQIDEAKSDKKCFLQELRSSRLLPVNSCDRYFSELHYLDEKSFELSVLDLLVEKNRILLKKCSKEILEHKCKLDNVESRLDEAERQLRNYMALKREDLIADLALVKATCKEEVVSC